MLSSRPGRRPTPRLPLALLGILALLAGLAPGLPTPGAQAAPDRPPRLAAPIAADLATGADATWLAVAQARIAQDEYAVTWQPAVALAGGGPAWQAPNRAQNLRSAFTGAGVRVAPRLAGPDATWEWGLALTAYGDPAAPTPAGPRLGSPEALRVEGALVSYSWPGAAGPIEEWFVNDTRGLKQSFTLAEAPPGAPATVVVDLTQHGDLAARLDPDGQGVDYLTAGGAVALRYDGLLVYDATGRALPARMELLSGGLRISADVGGAVYPVVIDPIVSTPAWTVESNAAGANFGYVVATAGDVNGDGFSDVVVGAPSFDGGYPGEGAAFLYLGGAGGLATTAAWTALGGQNDANFGSAVATAGDFNGDGFSDVIVGAPGYNSFSQTDVGRASIFLGASGGLAQGATWIRQGEQSLSFFGSAVATAGDVNGDGFSDVAVGSPTYASTFQGDPYFVGRVQVYHGSASPSADSLVPATDLRGTPGDDSYFGTAVGAAGDVNGDGYGDLIVGARFATNGESDEGRATLYLGRAVGLNPVPAWSVEGGQIDAHLGRSVGTAGDVNGDGYADIIVGAYQFSDGQIYEGRAFVYLGAAGGPSTTPAWTASGDLAGHSFGYSVGTAGDVNGDGYADVIVGASGIAGGEPFSGRAYLYLGGAGGLNAGPALTVQGVSGAAFGWAAATAGDVNGDGYSDMIVGSPDYSGGQAKEGRAYLYLGGSGLLAAAPTWAAEGNQGASLFGATLAGAGDVNGDGLADVVVGAPGFDNPESNEGRASLYLGAATASGPSATPAWTVEGGQAGASFGAAVGAAGDVNGDGYGDLIAGAPGFSNGQASEGRATVYLGSAGGLSTNPAWTVEGGTAELAFGAAVATAGDVNGDGFADVIVGAPGTNKGQTGGRAFLYFGSASGLSTTPAWSVEGAADARLGAAVGSAGDINGDGYSDVVVGAPGFGNGETGEGRAAVYLGAAAGPGAEPAWTAEGNATGASFGQVVATAGDVNRDGFSDLLVGAPGFSNGQASEGRAVVYLGDTTGLGANPTWAVETNQANAGLGLSAAAAGDINGDGFGDVLVGAPNFDNVETNEGRAFAYLGSAGGLSTTEGWQSESNQATAAFGSAVAGAGDINGDGFADVLVGASLFTGDTPAEGRAALYLGNAGPGRALTPQPRRSSGAAPIARLGRGDSETQLRLAARGLSPFGRGKVRLEWEVRPLGQTLTGTPTGQGAWTDTAVAGAALSELVTGLSGATPYTWQARLRYQPAGLPLMPASRWFSQNPAGPRETALRTADLTAPSATVAQAAGQADPASAGPILFTVTFNEDVVGFGGAGDVALSGTAGATTATVTGGPRSYTVAVSGMSAPGTVIVTVPAGAARDPGGNQSLAATAGDNTVTFTPSDPLVSGITLADPSPTRAAGVSFAVTFSEPVTGVDTGDFTLTATGVTGAAITGVSGSGAAWTVTASSGAGTGTLRLNVLDNDTIVDAGGNKLGGPGQGNGAYNGGPAYTLDRTAPTVTGAGLTRPPEGSAVLTFTITYSDNLSLDQGSMGNGDIVVSGPGGYSQPATLVQVSNQGAVARVATYTVPAPGGAWGNEDKGVYTFSLAAAAVTDGVGNPAAARAVGTLLVTYNVPLYLPIVVR